MKINSGYAEIISVSEKNSSLLQTMNSWELGIHNYLHYAYSHSTTYIYATYMTFEMISRINRNYKNI